MMARAHQLWPVTSRWASSCVCHTICVYNWVDDSHFLVASSSLIMPSCLSRRRLVQWVPLAFVMWSTVCSGAPHSQAALSVRHHDRTGEFNLPKPVLRQFNIVYAVCVWALLPFAWWAEVYGSIRRPYIRTFHNQYIVKQDFKIDTYTHLICLPRVGMWYYSDVTSYVVWQKHAPTNRPRHHIYNNNNNNNNNNNINNKNNKNNSSGLDKEL